MDRWFYTLPCYYCQGIDHHLANCKKNDRCFNCENQIAAHTRDHPESGNCSLCGKDDHAVELCTEECSGCTEHRKNLKQMRCWLPMLARIIKESKKKDDVDYRDNHRPRKASQLRL